MSQQANSPFIAPKDAPQWFLENLRQAGTSLWIDLEDIRLHCLTWNWERTTLPVLVLVHGFSGHARWWSFLAPFFTDRYRVLAVDLPGMGDSDAPSNYTDDSFSDALAGMIDQLALSDVTIIGHSFGGAQTIRTLAKRPAAFRRGIVVDAYITLPPEEPTRVIEPKGLRRCRETQAECVANFRLSPPQPLQDETIRQYIGHHSCRLGDDGWYWKFDPHLRNTGEIHGADIPASVPARVDCIYGELSMFNCDDKPQRILQSFANPGELIVVPGAFHHLMVDHPLQLVAAINQLLAH